jgi:lipoprotein NlpI
VVGSARHLLAIVPVLLAISLTRARADASDALQAARESFAQGRFAAACDLASEAIRSGKELPGAYSLRARCHEALEQHAAAVADYDELLKLEPRGAEIYDARGSQQFMRGRFEDSIADFDRAIELRPALAAGHWKRGISYYYAGKYELGRQQFEGYQQVDASDVENAVWRYLCMARGDGVDRARREILKIKHDARVPMMQIYELYSGQGTEQSVLDAVRGGNPSAAELKARWFYAELYLGLYDEAAGDNRLARQHIRAAAEQYRIAHYMGDVARVHAEMLHKAAECDPAP